MNDSERENLKKLLRLEMLSPKRELTVEELKFLYFSRFTDPGMDKLRSKRNKREDLARIFNCSPSEIGLKKEDLYNNQLVFFDNYIIYNNMYDKMRAAGLNLPKYTRFGVILPHVTSPSDLILPEQVGGTLALPALESIEGLDLTIKAVHIDLTNLRDGHGLVLSDDVGSYELSNLNSLVGVKLPDNRLSLIYHDRCYNLISARRLQEEEYKTYGDNPVPKLRRYGYRHNWYYKKG